MQETFSEAPPALLEGQVVNEAGAVRISRLAKETIPFGRVVVQLSTDADGTCRLPPAIPAADPDAIATAAVFVGGAAPVVLLAAAFDGVIGDGVIEPARNVVIAFAADADWNATTVVVEGLDAEGNEVTDLILVPDNGGSTVVGTVKFRKITRITIPAQAAACSGTVGVGVDVGEIKVLGVAVRDALREGPAPYAEFDGVTILTKGEVGMKVELLDATEYGDPVYTRLVAVLPEVRGTVRTGPDGTIDAPDCALVKGMMFASRNAAEEIAKVRVNIPAG